MDLIVLIALLFRSTSADCGTLDTFLTKLNPTEINGIDPFKVNEWFNLKTNKLVTSMEMGDGNKYDEFLVLQPPKGDGYVTYQQLDGNYDRFTALIGLAVDSHCIDYYGRPPFYDGFECKIYVDGELQYESKRIATVEDFELVNINTKGGNELKIEMHSGSEKWCDHAVVANPFLKYRDGPPSFETGSCDAGDWFRMGWLNDINQIWINSGLDDYDGLYNFYEYEFGIDYNGLIQPIIMNGWNKGYRVASLNSYPMGDDANQLRLGRTVFTFDLDGNPTPDNWYQYYYYTDTNTFRYSNGNSDCVGLYARRINKWTQIGTLGDITDIQGDGVPILGYPLLKYEYGIEYNSRIHRVMKNNWNQGWRVSAIDSYPMGDDSKKLQFGRVIFTQGLIGNDDPNDPDEQDWWHQYFIDNGDKQLYSQKNDFNFGKVEVFVKRREIMCG